MKNIRKLFSLDDKTVLITGSGSGLGFHIARGMGLNGARIILNGRNENKLKAAVREMKKEKIEVSYSVFDITEPKEVKNAVLDLEKDYGRIDVLINNAGIMIRSPLIEFKDQDWHTVINTNLTGAFNVAREVVKEMIRRKSGKIINICSLMSELGRNTTGAYAAAKGGLKMLTRAMATEWAQYDIQVNGIGPGYFLTDITRPLAENEEFDNWLKKRTPAGRWGDPDELIGTAIFLSSNASKFVNGQVIYVDGGILATI